jgi:hypothetical protein
VRIRLKGINSKRKRLADGSWRTYYSAWKGGPPLRGEQGTPEFIASYNAAVATKVIPPTGVLLSLLQGYQASDQFRSRQPRTREDYVRQIKIIEAEFGDFPLSALSDRRTRGVFMAWRDRLAMKSRRQADYAWVVLSMVLAWAMDRGLIANNPCARGGRAATGLIKSGLRMTRPYFCVWPPHTFICPCCSRCGRDKGKAICFGFLGPPMTAVVFGCGNRKPVRGLASRPARRSRLRSTARQSAAP